MSMLMPIPLQFYNDTFMSLPGGLKLLNDTLIVKTADHGDVSIVGDLTLHAITLLNAVQV